MITRKEMEREIAAIKIRKELKQEEEEEETEPVSPTGQYLNSSALSLYILAVLELEQVLDDHLILQLVKDVFLPINTRFSSIMVPYIYPSIYLSLLINLYQYD